MQLLDLQGFAIRKIKHAVVSCLLSQARVGHVSARCRAWQRKGRTGKSTTAMHVAVALMNVGQRVATIDLDSRQRTFTRYIENRRAWARKTSLCLKVPMHFCVARGSTLRLDENEAIEIFRVRRSGRGGKAVT